MKILFLIIFFPILSFSQQTYPCYVEATTDTVTAEKIYYSGWEQNGFSITQREKRDTIGIRIEEVIKLFFIRGEEKIYIPFIERKFLSGEKDVDLRFRGLTLPLRDVYPAGEKP